MGCHSMFVEWLFTTSTADQYRGTEQQNRAAEQSRTGEVRESSWAAAWARPTAGSDTMTTTSRGGSGPDHRAPLDPDDLAELLGEAPRFDAATVLAGDELGWLDLVERARVFGPDPAFAALDDAALVTELGHRAAHIAASTCAYLELVAELAVRRVWADHGARTPGQWLSHQLGLGNSTAADHLRVGLRLRELPAIRARFAAGRISYSKVRAITRIAVPETEELLLRWSQWATGAEVERIISAFRRTCHPGDGAPGPDRDRSYRSRRNGDGTTTLTIRLPDDEAAAVEANLDRLIDLDAPEGSREVPEGDLEEAQASSAEDGSCTVAGSSRTPSPTESARHDDNDPYSSSAEDTRQTGSRWAGWPVDAADDGGWVPDTSDLDTAGADTELAATWPPVRGLFLSEPVADPTEPPLLGLEGLLALDAADAGTVVRTRGTSPGAGSATDHGPVPLLPRQRTRSARRVDALVEACSAAVAAAGTDTSGMDRHTLVVRADIADLQAPESDPSVEGRVPVDITSGRIRAMDPAVLRRLACEAGVVLVATDSGLPIDVGRAHRRPTAAQRRALSLRDRSCRFPGCDTHRGLHAHHVVHWADDGPTDLSNLVLVCAFHHRFVHEHHWKVTPGYAGIFRFAPPAGPDLPPAHQLPDIAGSDDPMGEKLTEDAHGWALRPTHHHAHNLDLGLAVQVLHQELRAILPPTDHELDVAS